MTPQLYNYKVKNYQVVDGDTVDLELELGFSITVKERFRLLGINTPETRTRDKEEKARGLAAKEFLQEVLDDAVSVMVETAKNKRGKYGRYLAVLWIEDECNALYDVNKMLVDYGHAVKMEY